MAKKTNGTKGSDNGQPKKLSIDLTYIRAPHALPAGRHKVRYEFEKGGREPGAGGVGRLFVDGNKVAEGEIKKTSAFDYSLDETFDVGCDKGSPVTPEYRPLASFTGKIIRVDMDLSPDFVRDEVRHSEEHLKHVMLRE